jgi:outer membrane protein assembly factor BamA
VLEEATWVEAARSMSALYRSRGYLRATVRLAPVDLAAGEARARFLIDEGPRAELRTVEVRGLPVGFLSLTIDLARAGEVFSAETLDRLRQGVQHELSRKGYLFAVITASFTLDPGSHFADCLLAVEPGPQVKARAVLPVGNQRTADDVVLGQAAMPEGVPLDGDSLLKTQDNLMGLGIFRSAEVGLLSPERSEPLKTVLLKVRERPRIAGEFGLGYFLAEGPRLVFDLDAPNLGGRAVNLNAHGQLNWFALSAPALSRQVDVSDLTGWEQLGGRGTVSVGSRSLLPRNFGIRVDLVGERVFRPQFRFSRVAAVPTLDWSLPFELPGVEWMRPKLSVALQYELEWSRVLRTGSVLSSAALPTSLADQERLRFRFGTFALQTLRLSPTLDLRDNALNAHRGLLLQGSVEVTGALFAEDDQTPPQAVVVNFLKASGLLSVYLPVGSAAVLALSVRAGRIAPLANGSSTPPVKRFFLGGATSMRGFNEDQLIAEDLRAQYREEVRDCRVLAVKDGCTSAAQAIVADRQVPSQGGEVFALAKAELRFPVFRVFDLGLFLEAGNLWLSAPAGFGPFRTVAGVGVRYVTPIGPLALDLGVNLAPDMVINEPTFVVHFNIGVF